MHTAADLLNLLQKPSAHTAAEVIHAHSWDLTFSYKIALASHQFFLHKNPNLTSLQECIFIQRTYYKTMGLNHGHPKPQTLDLNHGFITNIGLLLNPNTPKTILSRNSAYKLQKPVELPTLRTVGVHAPTMIHANQWQN